MRAHLLPRRDVGFASLAATVVALVVAALLTTTAAPAAAATNPCGPPVTSVIACENTLPGDPPSDWQVTMPGDTNIQGYATSISVNVGETVNFKIKTPSTSYHLDILRMGYYQGNGARKVASGVRPTAALPQTQPACLTDTSTGLVDCGNWGVSASWAVPSTAVSGVYLAHLVRDDVSNSNGSIVPFVVRNDASHSDVVVQTSDETWQAYNTYGGNNLYSCTSSLCPPGSPQGYKGAFKVSYNRPINGNDDIGRSWLYYAEYPMIRFLEQNGYDVSYMSGVDSSTRGPLLLNHKLFVSSGHDEYWSGPQRANVENARDHGVNLAFFSGNEVFWKTRWENSTDGSSTPNRTLVTYKETHFDAPTDPQDPPTWTGAWADGRFSPPADGGRPANALTGQLFLVNSGTTDITVPASYAGMRLWRNTPVARLTTGSITLGAGLGTLGYEWDEDADDGFRPAGLFDLSSTTSNAAETFVDYATTTKQNQTATHHLTLYRASSGALVFGAGTVQWAWGLDGAYTGKAPDPTMQQATVNLFADMGVQPASLMSGLTATTASTDTTPPTSTISAPTGGTSVADGAKVTVSGTASDAGGAVAGVEISTDGGTTWHPATGTTNWSYTWIAHGSPTSSIRTRAVDDSGNLETPSAGVRVGVTCPCSVWGTNVTTGMLDSGDAGAIEVGMKFQTDTFGTVNGLRFYKFSTNTGTHVGNLWSSTGQLLATATFSGESGSGWQSVSFSQPVPINPNTTYVISYFAPAGHYAQTEGYMFPHPAPEPDGNDSLDSAPLHVLRNAAGAGNGNGLYSYNATSTFPINTYNGENYWVDPVFSPSPAPGQVTNVVATAGQGAVGLNWTAPSSGGAASTYTITPYIGSVAQAPRTVTGLPAPTSAVVTGLNNGTSYTFTVTASNPNGAGPASSPSNAVTPSTSAALVQNGGFEVGLTSWITSTLLPPTSSTVQKHSGSSSALLGAVSGTIPAADSSLSQTVLIPAGTSTLSFWYLPGTADSLCTTSCVWDWQEAQLRSTSGATLASIFKSNSNAQTWTQVTVDTSKYAGQSVVLWFNVHEDGSNPPDDTWMYLDDVSITVSGATATAPSAPTGVTATAGSGSATVSWTAPADGGSPITSYTVTPYVGTTAQTPTTVTGTPPAPTTTVSGLSSGTAYTFTVTATNAVGTSPASTASMVVTPVAGAPGAPTGVSATAGDASAAVSWTAPASDGGSPITSYTVTPYIGTTAQTPTTVTGTPPATSTTVSGLTNGTAYTFTVTATNAAGTSPASTASGAVTPAARYGVYSGTETPATPNANDSSQVEVGTQFQVSVPAQVVALRFYKGSQNTGTHTGHLWSAAGVLLATVTFQNETASGWQTAILSTPVTLQAGATYTASYWTGTGHYAAQSGQFSSPLSSNVYVTGTAGVYRYGTSGAAAPTSSFNGSGYYVDALVAVSQTTATAPSAPTGVTAAAGSSSATVSWAVPANGGSPITSYTVTPYIGTTAQTATTVTGSPPTTSAVVTGLTNGTAYTFTVTATNSVGTSPASAPSSAVTPTAQYGVYSGTEIPANPNANDPSQVEVGTQFSVSAPAQAVAIRFYKGSANTGTHTGHLWSAAGVLLATVTFQNETASGWQTAYLSSPVALTPNTTYTVSYWMTNGGYAYQGGQFASPQSTNVYVTGTAGVYRYGANGSGIPTSSFNNTGYYVDALVALQ